MAICCFRNNGDDGQSLSILLTNYVMKCILFSVFLLRQLYIQVVIMRLQFTDGIPPESEVEVKV